MSSIQKFQMSFRYISDNKLYKIFYKENTTLLNKNSLIRILKEVFPDFDKQLILNMTNYLIPTETSIFLLSNLWQFFLVHGMIETPIIKIKLNNFFYILNNLGQLHFSYKETQLFPTNLNDIKCFKKYSRFTFTYYLILAKNKQYEINDKEVEKLQDLCNKIFDLFSIYNIQEQCNVLYKYQVSTIISKIQNINKNLSN